MSAIYRTSDYFRDSYWAFDVFLDFLIRIKPQLKKLISNLLNFDYETHIFRIIENLPYAFFIFLLGTFLAISLLRVTEEGNGIRVSTILTNSMSAKILPGSLVIAVPKGKYLQDDIISYNERSVRSGELTGRKLTHRIIEVTKEKNEQTFIVKGDNNVNPDPGSIKYRDILGKVVLIVPYLGYIDFLVSTIPGFIIFILIPSILLVLEAKRYAAS